jgi:hypothetical protein
VLVFSCTILQMCEGCAKGTCRFVLICNLQAPRAGSLRVRGFFHRAPPITSIEGIILLVNSKRPARFVEDTTCWPTRVQEDKSPGLRFTIT